MASAGTVTLNLDANSVKLLRELQKSERASRKTSKQIGQDWARVGKQLALAAVATGSALALITKKSVEFADSIGKTADKVGVSTDALQELRFAASQAGVAQSALDMGLQRFSRRVGEAVRGQGELRDTLKQYNIELRNADGSTRSVEAILRDYADAVAGATSSQEQLRLAFKGFDSEGAALVNLLRGGAQAIDGFAHQAGELGIVLEEKLIRNAEEVADKMDILSRVLQVRVSETVLKNAESILALTDAILRAVDAAVKGAAHIVPFMTWLGEEIASRVNGIAADDVIRLEQRLTTVRDQIMGLDSLWAGPSPGRDAHEARLREEEAQLLRLIALANERPRMAAPPAMPAPAAVDNPASPLASVAEDVADAMSEAQRFVAALANDVASLNLGDIDRALFNLSTMEGFSPEMLDGARQMLEWQRDTALALAESEARAEAMNQAIADAMTPAEKLTAEYTRLNLLLDEGLDKKTYARLVIAAQEEFDKATDIAEDHFASLSVFADEAARRVQGAFADFLFDPFEDGLKGMLRSFIETLRRMAAEAASAKILDFVTGAISAWAGGPSWLKRGTGFASAAPLPSGFSLTGARADGGPVKGGGTYLVGERGPELFVPGTSGQIVPNHAMGGSVIVNIDARQSDDPARLLSLVPVIQSQIEQSIDFKMRRGYL